MKFDLEDLNLWNDFKCAVESEEIHHPKISADKDKISADKKM